MNTVQLAVPEEYDLERIDKVITCCLETDTSRSCIQKLIKSGDILVNGKQVKANYKAKTDDLITVSFPEEEEISVEPQEIPLNIVYEDSDIIVVNKQPGLVVHPGAGNRDRTLVNGLLWHCRELSGTGGALRPGIVHRLDKDTSGLMVAAKNDSAHRKLAQDFFLRNIKKEYCAVVTGRPKTDHFTIDLPLARHKKYRHKMTVDENGREAVTECFLDRVWNVKGIIFSCLKVRIHTGRTHQIRVHLSAEGMPIVGDPIYSKKWEKYRVPYLLLASVRLGFNHPATGEFMEFSVSLPDHMEAFMDRLGKSDIDFQ